MKPAQHLVISGAVSGVLYGLTRSPAAAVASFAAGFLIDLDHVVDYWREYPARFDPKHFIATCYECRFRKLYLWLHSLELVPALALAAVVTRSPLLFGLTLGMAHHLALDFAFNEIYPKSYFLAYRWRRGFRAVAVFTNARSGGG